MSCLAGGSGRSRLDSAGVVGQRGQRVLQPQPSITVQPFPMSLPGDMDTFTQVYATGLFRRSKMARPRGSGIDFLPPLSSCFLTPLHRRLAAPVCSGARLWVETGKGDPGTWSSLLLKPWSAPESLVLV